MPGAFSRGMIIEIIIKDCFRQNPRGKLYGIKSMGHVLYVVLVTQKGLNPSLVSPNLTLRRSATNSGYCSSKSFNAFASAGCLKTSSFILPL